MQPYQPPTPQPDAVSVIRVTGPIYEGAEILYRAEAVCGNGRSAAHRMTYSPQKALSWAIAKLNEYPDAELQDETGTMCAEIFGR